MAVEPAPGETKSRMWIWIVLLAVLALAAIVFMWNPAGDTTEATMEGAEAGVSAEEALAEDLPTVVPEEGALTGGETMPDEVDVTVGGTEAPDAAQPPMVDTPEPADAAQ